MPVHYPGHIEICIEMLGLFLFFLEGWKLKNPRQRKTLKQQEENQQQTQPTYRYGTGMESNPSHIGEIGALSPLYIDLP